MILVVSHPRDDHATAVLGALKRAGHPAVLLDTARFPIDAGLRAGYSDGLPALGVRLGGGFDVQADDGWSDLADCRAIWWRRPQPYELDPGMDAGALQWAYQECHEALAGTLASVPARWVNDSYADERASHKPYQLAVAARLGIPFPRTLVTTDPAQARVFIEANGPGNTIYKTFRATEAQWRETRLITDAELERLDSLRLAPTIFQERVEAVADLRVTLIEREVFATQIRKREDLYAHDYRLSMDAVPFEPIELPAEWVGHLHRLMDALGLVYGAVDLMRRPDGTLVFLELNPSGEWLFVSDRTGTPITDAMAAMLRRLDRQE